MKNLIVLFLLCFVLGCNTVEKNKLAVLTGNNLQAVEFLNQSVYLPAGFQPVHKEDNEAAAEYLANFDANSVLFVDRQNGVNSITFMPADYTKLSKPLINYDVNDLERHFSKEGLAMQRLEAKMLRYGSAEIIKIKYLQALEEAQAYITQYVVSHDLETYIILVRHQENQDVLAILKSTFNV